MVSVGFYCGCSNINTLHDPYLQQGEMMYSGQLDSVKVFPGKNRVKITYWNYDPKVARLTVYWDFRQGSRQFDVPSDRLGEEIEIIIDQLNEKSYTFELVTFNREGKNPSVPFNITGTVYGSIFEASLSNRKIISAMGFPLENNKMVVDWANTIDRMVGVELLYRNTSDEETVLLLPNDEMNTVITDSKEVGLMYRTLFLPEANCIDVFNTSYTPIDFIEDWDEKLDKSKFLRWNPPGIPYSVQGGYHIEALWNDVYVEIGYLTSNASPLPHNVTFDMGQAAKLNRIRVWQRLSANNLIFASQNVRKFQLLGSPHPEVNEDFETWLFLGDFESVKPSRLPLGQTTEDDIEYAMAGEVYTIQENGDVPIRYIRMFITETWGGIVPAAMGEIEFFGEIEK